MGRQQLLSGAPLSRTTLAQTHDLPTPANPYRKASVSIEAGASVVLSGSVLLGARRMLQSRTLSAT
jgi:hypothetical protein